MERAGVADVRGNAPAMERWMAGRVPAALAARPVLIGICACALFLAVAALILWHLRVNALADAKREQEILGLTLAQHILRTVQSIDNATRPERDRFSRPGAWKEPAQAVRARLQSQVVKLPGVAGIAVVSGNGRIAYASDSDASAGTSLGEQSAYFAERSPLEYPVYAANASATPVFGLRTFWMSRRITSADGTFAGVLAVALHADYFEDLFRGLAASRATRVGLYRADGTAVFQYETAADVAYIEPVNAPRGEEHYLTTLHAIPRFPLFVKTSTPRSVVLAGWEQTAQAAGVITAFAGMLVGLLAGLHARQSHQYERDRRRLREHQGLLHEAQRIAHVGSASYDSRTGLVLCSDEARRILALEPAPSWRRHEVLARVHPADRGLLVHAVLTSRRGGHADVELRVGLRRHYERWVLVRTAVSEDSGAPIVRAALVDITERKGAELSRAQLAAIVESTEDAVMSMTPEGTILAWNRAAQRLFGYDATETVGRNIGLLFPADQTADTHRLLEMAGSGRSIEHYDTIRRSKHGDEVHVALTVSPILDERDRITAVSFMARDVTSQKKSQMRRNVEHAVMRALLEAGTTDRAMLRVIRTLCQALGWDYGARWCRDAGVHRLMPAESWCSTALESTGLQGTAAEAETLFPHLVQRVWETGWTLLRQDLALDAESPMPPAAVAAGLRCALVFPIKSQSGPVGVLLFLTRELRDADAELLETADMVGSQLGQYIERQRAEEERAAADARLHRIMANIPDAVFQFKRAPDGSFSFPFMSERVSDLYGERAADVQRDHTLLFTPVLEDQRRQLQKSMLRSKRTGEPWLFETLIRCKNGTRRWVRGQASVSYGSDGSVYWDGVLTDITAHKRAALEILTLNEELEQRVAERTHQLEAINQELEAFSYSVSHDLRVPLRAMDGYTRLLHDQYASQLDENASHYLDRVVHATRRMSELVDDLLQLARISRSELKVSSADLSHMAKEILHALGEDAPERRMEMRIEDDIIVQGDVRLLRIVLENLIGNAWKFTQRTELPVIAFGKEQMNGEQVLYVRDNGAGFDMKRAHKLFGAFQRLHRASDFEGNGIGLATVRRIITLHGGRVWATGEPNAGAAFYFTVPPAYRGR